MGQSPLSLAMLRYHAINFLLRFIFYLCILGPFNICLGNTGSQLNVTTMKISTWKGSPLPWTASSTVTPQHKLKRRTSEQHAENRNTSRHSSLYSDTTVVNMYSINVMNQNSVSQKIPFSYNVASLTPFKLIFLPPEIQKLPVNSQQNVVINCSTVYTYRNDTNKTYLVTIESRNAKVAVPFSSAPGTINGTWGVISMWIDPTNENIFTVRALRVGRAVMVIRVTQGIAVTSTAPTEYTEASPPPDHMEYRVAVVRRVRFANFIFDWTVATVAMLNSFGIGCVTDRNSVRNHLRRPAPVIIGVSCQLIVMPCLSIGIAKLLQLTQDLALGMVYVACVPGGGAGQIITAVMKGDTKLSVTISLVSTVLSMGTLPLWLLTAREIFPEAEDSLLYVQQFEIWLSISAGAHLFGMLVHAVRPGIAEACLTWFLKPMLLLLSILFVTLGMYINVYVFTLVNAPVLVAAALLPLGGFLLALGVSLLLRRDHLRTRAIASEASTSHCMLVLEMTRFALPQPEADIVSSMSIWVLFFTPLPLLVTFISTKAKHFILKHCSKQRQKYKHLHIVSSLLNVTNVTNLSTNGSTKENSPYEDHAVLIDGDNQMEKVTVL